MQCKIKKLGAEQRKTTKEELHQMKEKLFIALTALAAIFVGSQAWACLWGGYWGGADEGFFDGTAQLRQNFADRRSEYQALLAQPNQDPKKVSDLNRQITMLNDQLVAQARSSNLPVPGGSYGNYRNNSYGSSWDNSWCW